MQDQQHIEQLNSQWPDQAAVMGKSWKETIFKILAGSINVSICNVEGKNLTDVHKIPSLSEINPMLPNLLRPG